MSSLPTGSLDAVPGVPGVPEGRKWNSSALTFGTAPDDAIEYVDLFDVPYPNGIDGKGIVAIDYGVKGIPEKIFIDPNGVISKKFVGPINADTLRATLNGLLKGTRRLAR